ncbi:MAG: hypothetical protein A2626_02525 [Candidatus Nealsonbacteria bacterium RIFCSPHIGHO2_01_FULL_38_55]|uniref:Transposase IS200-like domain-containing protein n=1 Tax=Candidatus Nealsonbacteria bacterium RIFCSPHIGHO2_01_FULL_38_55 TaxID=1801664 RepID=A0A1G2E316_9BACT|nr:MAG: hypothetical protein A2626_02525 [Candidatus Nealsonbacteria bacterium RIFCSPHIGHO2_01_FULL_38_55]
MKREFVERDYVHAYNRGNRKMDIFYNDSDKWRFMKMIRYFNNEEPSKNILRQLFFLNRDDECDHFEWPKNWAPQKPLVKILTYCLKTNHFHLLMREIIKGGITKFMHKLGEGYTNYINAKYGESGRIFQGTYKSKIIKEANVLQYIDIYIQVLNVFELYPGGIEGALKEFDKAFEFAMDYPFCSLGESFGKRRMEIIDREIFGEMFTNLEAYKEVARDALLVRNIREIMGKLVIE